MDPLTVFLLLKVGLGLALIAFAMREIRIARRPDTDPEYTRKLVHVFSAAQRKRQRVQSPDAAPSPATAPEPEEAPRRAA